MHATGRNQSEGKRLFTGGRSLRIADVLLRKTGRWPPPYAPSSAKHQWSEYFCYGIVYCCCFKYTCKQIVPEALNLHIFITDESKIYKHVQTDKKLHDTAGILMLPDKQENPERYGQTDITEIEKILNCNNKLNIDN